MWDLEFPGDRLDFSFFCDLRSKFSFINVFFLFLVRILLLYADIFVVLEEAEDEVKELVAVEADEPLE